MPAARKSFDGVRFGSLIVVCDGDDVVYKNLKVRMVICICDCGTIKPIRLGNLNSKSTISCGCVKAKKMKEGINTIHGLSSCRLFECWRGMKRRSKDRGDSCCVYHEWDISYDNFREWSLANGYTDDMILCRNGDEGNYEPNNCRWDTYQSNGEEALAKHYKIKNPDGELVEIYNIRKFSRDNGLHASTLLRVMNGGRRHHKNWTRWEET